MDGLSFVFENLPDGLETVFFTQMNVGDSDKKVDHFLLSDGFSSVSVYAEVKSKNVQLGEQILGSVNSFTGIIKDYQITAMGDVPVKVAQVIAQRITFQ